MTFCSAGHVHGQDRSGCRVNGQAYRAYPDSTELQGHVNEPVIVSVLLEPSTMPSGHFITNNINLIHGPTAVDLTPGFPDIKVIFTQPGEYVLEITTSFISKSSCGGISACSIEPETVRIVIQCPKTLNLSAISSNSSHLA